MLINRDLMGEARTVRLPIAGMVLAKFIKLAASLVQVTVIAEIIAHVFAGTAAAVNLPASAAWILGAVALRTAATLAENHLAFHCAAQVKTILRTRLYKKLLELELGYQLIAPSSAVVSAAVDGIEALDLYFSRYLPQLFYSILAPLSLFLYLVRIYPPAAYALLLAMPLIPLSIFLVTRLAKRRMAGFWSSYEGLADFFLQSLQGLVTLKVFGADERRSRELNEKAWSFRNVTMRVLRLQLTSIAFMDLIAFAGAAASIWLAAGALREGATSLAGAVVILFLSAEFFIPMRVLGSYFHSAMNGVAAAERIYEGLRAELPVKDSGHASLPPSWREPLVFDSVSFAYASGRPILQDLSLTLVPGTTTALVGVSGSGKSTIARLLLRLFEPAEGQIYLGTTPLRAFSLKDLRRRIVMVFQHSYVFAGSIKDNLLLARPGATELELYSALDTAGLLDFVKAQPEGLDASVGEWGGKLSGGQKQRLAIARAILHDPDVFVFDEATANVDVESESHIWTAISRIARTKTLLIISHRLATIKNADQIAVLHQGTIVERGRHDQLLDQDGLYSRLFREQQELERYGSEARQLA
ncbi:MAG TPA: ABC transporter ATP-binding protein/permease [Bacillota bacterium]|nr:ABC transporter ATP-binding protein/permease [Bacillota bacterium]